MKKAFFSALFSACLVQTAMAADLSPPQQFEIYYGNALSGGVTVRMLDDGNLVIERRYIRDVGQEVVEPSPEAWARFRKRLDRLKIWKWKKSYPTPGLRDGTQWRVLLVYKDRTLDASGSGSYPRPGGVSTKWPEKSQHFQDFLNDVQDLIGQELR